MRKKNILLSLFVGALSIGALASCGKKKEDKKDTTTSENTLTGPLVSETSGDASTSTSTSISTSTSTSKETSTTTSHETNYEVDETVYNSFFGDYNDRLSKLNIKFAYKEYMGSGGFEGTIEIANNMALDTYYEIGNEQEVYKYFYLCDEYDEEKDELHVRNVDYKADGSIDDYYSFNYSYYSMTRSIYMPCFNFDDLTYNPETKSYESDEIIIDNRTYCDISIQFEDNKLVSYSFEYENETCEIDVLQIGGVEIENTVKYLVTSDAFNTYFGEFTYSFPRLNIQYNYETTGVNHYIGEMSISNFMVLEKYNGYTTGKHFNKLVDYDEENDKVVFEISYDDKNDDNFSELLSADATVAEFRDYIYLPGFELTDLTYNEETNAYEASACTVDGLNYKNVSIKFEDNKLKSYSYITCRSTGEEQLTCEVTSIGDVKVTNPVPNYVSSYTFDKFFNFTAEGLKDLNITLNYEIDGYTGTRKYGDDLLLNVEVNDASQAESKTMMYIDEITDESVKVRYYRYDASSGEWGSETQANYGLDEFKLQILNIPRLTFSSLDYNPETKAYEKSQIASQYGTSFVGLSNVSVKFVDGVLASYQYTKDGYTYIITVSDYGTTDVEDLRQN